MATTVTGPIGATYDAVFDGISATLTRVGGVVGYAETGGAIAPDQKTYVTSGGGVLTMDDLKPGRYTLSLSVPISESTSQTKLWQAAGVIPADAGDNITLNAFLTANAETITPTLVQQAVAAANRAQAWAESPTPPDPNDPDSRSAKAVAETLGTLSELEDLAERGEAARDAAEVYAGVVDQATSVAGLADPTTLTIGDKGIVSGSGDDAIDGLYEVQDDSGNVWVRIGITGLAGKLDIAKFRSQIIYTEGWTLAVVNEDGFVLWGQRATGDFVGDITEIGGSGGGEGGIVVDGAPGAFSFADETGAAYAVLGRYDEATPSGLRVPRLLSWVEPWRDPSKDLAVTWFSSDPEATVLRWGRQGEALMHKSSSFYTRPLGAGVGGLWLHSALIEGLERYPEESVIEYRPVGYAESDTVKVCPRSDVRWIGLSDYHYGFTGPLENVAANVSGDLDLLVFNGDARDDHGRFDPIYIERTARFFLNLTEEYRTGDGHKIPMVVTIGNHDGKGGPLGPTPFVAFSHGDGIPGPVPYFFVCGYHPSHPQRYDDSVFWIRVDYEAVMIFLNADHTVPIAEPRVAGDGPLDPPPEAPLGSLQTQFDWFRSVAHRYIPQSRTAYIVSHSGPFSTYTQDQWERTETAVMRMRYLREIQEYPNVLAWLEGHSHKIQLFAPMVVDYDDALSWQDNIYRFKAYDGSDRVLRVFGSGPSGGNWRAIHPDFIALESPLDSSGIFDVAVHNNAATTAPESTAGANLEAVNAINTITNMPGELWHGWVFEATETHFRARCVGSDEPLIYEHEETI